MNRRGFLTALSAAIAGATLDPEKLLWEPGKKLISIPNPGGEWKWDDDEFVSIPMPPGPRSISESLTAQMEFVRPRLMEIIMQQEALHRRLFSKIPRAVYPGPFRDVRQRTGRL